MLQHYGSSLPDATNQSQENRILAEFEGMLNGSSADHGQNGSILDHAARGWTRRIVAIVLLAGVGAALALVPIGLKPGMTTGRSVAHTSGE